MVVTYCYLERDNNKCLKVYMSNFSCFEISTSLLTAALPQRFELYNKRQGRLLEEIR